jgi:hypothetical protein
MIDQDALHNITRERKSKLDHIQCLLFDNRMQEEKHMTSAPIVREPRMDKGRIFSINDGASKLRLPGE